MLRTVQRVQLCGVHWVQHCGSVLRSVLCTMQHIVCSIAVHIGCIIAVQCCLRCFATCSTLGAHWVQHCVQSTMIHIRSSSSTVRSLSRSHLPCKAALSRCLRPRVDLPPRRTSKQFVVYTMRAPGPEHLPGLYKARACETHAPICTHQPRTAPGPCGKGAVFSNRGMYLRGPGLQTGAGAPGTGPALRTRLP